MNDLELDAMNTALRVLTALTRNHKPHAADLLALRFYAGPEQAHLGDQLLAGEIVQRALQNRREGRASAATA